MQQFEKGNTINLSGVETKRTYHFQDRNETFENPTKLEIKSDNTHVITCDSGTHVVDSDWLAFSFEGHFEFNVSSDSVNHFTDVEPKLLNVKYELSDEVFNFMVPCHALLQKESGSLMVKSGNGSNFYFNKGFKSTAFV